MTGDHQVLRRTFDNVARLYDTERPGYPEALFEDVISLSEIPAGGRILEIGCGTGQATLPLARRGYEMLCIELGENLAAIARQSLSRYPRVKILTGDFESWPVEVSAFDLVVSAESFHWLDLAVAYRKINQALNPGGSVALFWNRHVWSERS